MFGTSIRARVKRALADRITKAEEEHKLRCGELDQVCVEEVAAAEQRRDDSKEEHAAALVRSIIGTN